MQPTFNFPDDAVHVITNAKGEHKLITSMDDVEELFDDCPLCQMLKEDLAKKA